MIEDEDAQAGGDRDQVRPRNTLFIISMLLLVSFLSPAGADPTFTPNAPNVELAPGAALPIGITPETNTDRPERLVAARWTENAGAIDRKQELNPAGDSIGYQVPANAQHCTDLSDELVVDWEYYTDGVFLPGTPDASTPINVIVNDPLIVNPTASSISGAPGSVQRVTLALVGGRTPYQAPTSSSNATVSLANGVLTYRIPADATGDYRDTVTINSASAGNACGGNSVSIAINVSITPDSLTIDPQSANPGDVQPGETVETTFRVSGGIPEYSAEIVAGPSGATVGNPSPSDGAMTFRYSVPSDAVAGTNSFRIQVSDSGTGETQQRVTAAVTFNVVAPTPDALIVSPSSSNLGEVQPGETVESTFAVSGGTPVYAATITSGPDGASLTTPSPTDGSMTFRYSVPANASSGALGFTLSVRDSGEGGAQQSVTATVTLNVAAPARPPLTANPGDLSITAPSLVGVTNNVDESFAVSGGTPPYNLSVVGVSGGIVGRVEPAQLATEGRARYLVEIPANAPADLRFENRIQITDATGALLAVVVETNVNASNTLSTLPNLSPNQRNVAQAIETVCPRLATMSRRTAEQEDLFTQCSEMLANPRAAGIPNTLLQVTSEKAIAAKSASIETGTQQLANIGSRLAALRSGSKGFDFGALSLNVDGQNLSGSQLASLASAGLSGGGASADGAFGNWGFFLNGSVNFGDRDKTLNESGFDYNSAGITGGADYRLSDTLVAGGAFGYGKNNVNFDAQGGGLDTETWHLAAYATKYLSQRTYIDAIVEYGWNDYSSKRNVSYQITSGLDPVRRQAKADYSGSQLGASLGAGYDVNEGPFAYGVYGRVGYLQVDVDAFREQGADGLNLAMSGFDATSVTTVLGARISRVINTSMAVLVPQARLEWEHEYDDDADSLTARFAADPTGTAFGILTDSPDRDYFRIGLGLSAVFPHGFSSFVNYNTLLDKQDWTDHMVDVGVRWEFY